MYPSEGAKSLYYSLQSLKNAIPNVVVKVYTELASVVRLNDCMTFNDIHRVSIASLVPLFTKMMGKTAKLQNISY